MALQQIVYFFDSSLNYGLLYWEGFEWNIAFDFAKLCLLFFCLVWHFLANHDFIFTQSLRFLMLKNLSTPFGHFLLNFNLRQWRRRHKNVRLLRHRNVIGQGRHGSLVKRHERRVGEAGKWYFALVIGMRLNPHNSISECIIFYYLGLSFNQNSCSRISAVCTSLWSCCTKLRSVWTFCLWRFFLPVSETHPCWWFAGLPCSRFLWLTSARFLRLCSICCTFSKFVLLSQIWVKNRGIFFGLLFWMIFHDRGWLALTHFWLLLHEFTVFKEVSQFRRYLHFGGRVLLLFEMKFRK